jgi:CheY-like chemotaxis protein
MAEQNKPELRAVHIEDDPQWQDIVTEILEDVGATLILTLDSMEEAEAAIILMEKLKIDLVILDGNLTDGDFSGDDATRILELMGEKGSLATVIGLSGSSLRETDIDLGKGNIVDLSTTITGIFSGDE